MLHHSKIKNKCLINKKRITKGQKWCGVGVKADCLKKGPRPIGRGQKWVIPDTFCSFLSCFQLLKLFAHEEWNFVFFLSFSAFVCTKCICSLNLAHCFLFIVLVLFKEAV